VAGSTTSQYRVFMVRRRSSSVNGLSSSDVRGQGVDTLFMQWLVGRAAQNLVDDVLRPVGLTGDELPVYSMLASDAPVTPTELARWMAAPATTVSSVVKRLESRGHAARERHPDDRRSYRIRLTPAGRHTHEAAIELFRPVSTAVESRLGADRASVEEALLRFREAIDQVREQRDITRRSGA
jgi:DNA-binding MarR family transcriptional regulator